MGLNENNSELNAVLALHKALDAKFAKDIVLMELTGRSLIADYFIIATGGSAPQLAALTQTAEEVLKNHGLHLHHIEGLSTAKWVLLDFGSVIVHLFDKESREYYNLERIWGDARVISP